MNQGRLNVSHMLDNQEATDSDYTSKSFIIHCNPGIEQEQKDQWIGWYDIPE